MQTSRNRTCTAVMVTVGALILGCTEDGKLPRNSQTIDGMTIDLGVMPAELVRGHPTGLPEPNARPGATEPFGSWHHLVVALFDVKTGARITDARIRAGVGKRTYNHAPDIVLEPMWINGARAYSTFVFLQGEGGWRIHLEIVRPGAQHPTEADFTY